MNLFEKMIIEFQKMGVPEGFAEGLVTRMKRDQDEMLMLREIAELVNDARFKEAHEASVQYFEWMEEQDIE